MGTAEIRVIDGVRHVFVTDNHLREDAYETPSGWTLKVADNDRVEVGDVILEKDNEVITAQHAGRVAHGQNGLRVIWESRDERDYEIPVCTDVGQ